MSSHTQELARRQQVKDFKRGLTLGAVHDRYLQRLLKHNWLHCLESDPYVYRQHKKEHDRLLAIANKGGVYAVLFERVKEAKMVLPTTG